MPSKLATGTICLVRFHPSTGSELKRFRPAVVVSEKISQADPRFILIAPFTTNTDSYQKNYELLVKKNKTLEQDSVLLCWYLRIIDINRVEAILGKLKLTDIKQMQAKVKQLL